MANTLDTYSDSIVMKAFLTRDSSEIDNEFEDDVVTQLRPYAFAGGTDWDRISLPSVTSIGNCAFFKTEVATELDIDWESLTHIGFGAFGFSDCITDNSITLTLTTIDDCAFMEAQGLTHVTWTAEQPMSQGYGTFATYQFPYELSNDYSTNNSLNTHIGIFNNSSIETLSFPNATQLATNLCSNMTNLTSVSAPNVTTIYSTCFSYCTSLVTANFGSLTSLMNEVFYRCTSLANVDSFKDTVQSIGAYSFYYCESLTAVNFSVCTTIGSYSFRSCTSLASVNMPLLTSIGTYAFTSCSALRTVVLGNVTVFPANAFELCGALNSVTWSGTALTEIGNRAFAGCNVLASFNGDTSNVTKIGDSAFMANSNSATMLSGESLSFPSCTSLGERAFYQCAVTNLTLNAVTQIAKPSVFSYCKMETITMNNLTTIDAGQVFAYCPNLHTVSLPSLQSIAGGNTFSSCASLKRMSFPELRSIYAKNSDSSYVNGYTFSGCFKYDANEPTWTLTFPKLQYWTDNTPFGNSTSHTYPDTSKASFTSFSAPMLTEIPDGCFKGNVYCTDYSLPLVETIGKEAFAYSAASNHPVGTIQFPSCTYVGESSFAYSYVTQVVFGGTTVQFGYHCFQGVERVVFRIALPNITALPTLDFVSGGTVNDLFGLATYASKSTFYVPTAMLATWQADTYWSQYNVDDIANFHT